MADYRNPLTGQLMNHPYDPRIVARWMYHGWDVSPDQGLSPDELRQQHMEINDELSKLYGEDPGNLIKKRDRRPGFWTEGGGDKAFKSGWDLSIPAFKPREDIQYNKFEIQPPPEPTPLNQLQQASVTPSGFSLEPDGSQTMTRGMKAYLSLFGLDKDRA